MPRIFISYRRDDSRTITGRIYDRLSSEFGKENVFRDLDGIALGSDFRRVIEREVSSCDFLLAIIGSRWVTIADSQGRKRIDDPSDFVRLEVETALRLPNVTVIPVYVDGVRGISAADLPPTLADLPYRNAAVVRDDPDFHGDVDKLIVAIKRLVPVSEAIPTAPPSRARLAPKLIIGLLALIVVIAVIATVANNLRQSADPTPTPTTQAAVIPSSTNTSLPPTPTNTPVPSTPQPQPTTTVTINYLLDETATQIMLQRTADAKAATNAALFAESTHIVETANARPTLAPTATILTPSGTPILATATLQANCFALISSSVGATDVPIYSTASISAPKTLIPVGTKVIVLERLYGSGNLTWYKVFRNDLQYSGWIQNKNIRVDTNQQCALYQ